MAKYTVNPANGAMTYIFGKVFKGSGDDSLSFAISESGDIGIGTGITNSFSGNPNDDDMLVVKIDSSNGKKEWSKVFDHGLKDHDPTVIPISGGYMLSSSVENTTSGGQDILVAKLNLTGDPVWAKLYGGTGLNGATIHEISGGNYLLVGTTKSTSLFDFNTDIILIKINGSGDIVWGRNIPAARWILPALFMKTLMEPLF